jgi:hypothetical protein
MITRDRLPSYRDIKRVPMSKCLAPAPAAYGLAFCDRNVKVGAGSRMEAENGNYDRRTSG